MPVVKRMMELDPTKRCTARECASLLEQVKTRISSLHNLASPPPKKENVNEKSGLTGRMEKANLKSPTNSESRKRTPNNADSPPLSPPRVKYERKNDDSSEVKQCDFIKIGD